MMNRLSMRAWALALGSAVVLIAVSAGVARGPEEDDGYGEAAAQPGATAAMESFQKGMQAVNEKDYKKAVEFFQKADDLEKDNPEFLNMLAFSQRKTGKVDLAIENYNRALKLRPRFSRAREYLGEAYIQAAMREMETLRSYGKDGEKDLQLLIAALKEAAASVKKGK